MPYVHGRRALRFATQDHADEPLRLRLRLLHQPPQQRHPPGLVHGRRAGRSDDRFYRRNYIEGLFLSSGVLRNPDYTMERMVRVVRELRTVHRFNGYIHMKSIPGASAELVHEAGLYADRLSVNVEIPTDENLRRLAPEKNHASVYAPMGYIQQGVLASCRGTPSVRHAPRFAPAGQSTQMSSGRPTRATARFSGWPPRCTSARR